MKSGEFNNIDELLKELNLIPGTRLSIGGETDYFECCHFDIKPDINYFPFKEGWITDINVYFGENDNGDSIVINDFSINLKIKNCGFNYPSMIVNKSWFDKNVSKIHIWSCKG